MSSKTRGGERLMNLTAVILVSVLCVFAASDVGFAAEQTSFYQGKVIRIVVGTAPGGGFDVYARALRVTGANTFPAILKCLLKTSQARRRLW